MNPGKLDIYGYIEYDTGDTKNKGGETIQNWRNYSFVWLQRVAKLGSEQVIADEITGIITDTFRLRYDSGITQKMRLIIDATVYNIISVNYIDRMYMTIDTEKTDSKEYIT